MVGKLVELIEYRVLGLKGTTLPFDNGDAGEVYEIDTMDESSGSVILRRKKGRILQMLASVQEWTVTGNKLEIRTNSSVSIYKILN